MEPLLLSPSDFVALVNQTLEFAYPRVVVEGELANFRVSKNRWVYFDLKDEFSSVKFFGTVYSLPGPLEEGMTLRVIGSPRLHPLYGFSVNIQNISLAGEGTIKKAFDLLFRKLTLEGLFEAERKRALPYPPSRIGLITSNESAAYADFIKITSARWGGMEIELADVQVQGEAAARQIVRAIEYFNSIGEPPEVLVIIRGGGSADDLQTFNTEIVTRAVGASRIPTIVAIGHEVDTTLAELAADLRASTPSNAAELLTPDRSQVLREMRAIEDQMRHLLSASAQSAKRDLELQRGLLEQLLVRQVVHKREELNYSLKMLELLNPQNILKRGYAVVRRGTKVVRKASEVSPHQTLDVLLSEGNIQVEVQ